MNTRLIGRIIIVFCLGFLCSNFVLPQNVQNRAEAQVLDRIKNIISSNDSIINNRDKVSDSLIIKQKDSLIKEYQLNEQNLKMELAQFKYNSDSLNFKKEFLKQRIDSLRKHVKGVAVKVEQDTLFFIYAKKGGYSPSHRAELIENKLISLGKDYNLQPDSVYIEKTEIAYEIMYGELVIASVTDMDAIWMGLDCDKVAEQWRQSMVLKLTELKQEHSLMQLFKRIFFFILIIALLVFSIKLLAFFYKKAKGRINRSARIKPFNINGYDLLSAQAQVKMIIFAVNILRYALVLLILIFVVPLLFSIFPHTEDLAIKIFSYIWNPFKSILKSIVAYIPNLFTIVVIVLFVKYIIKLIKYLAKEVDEGRLKINGFYSDWAYPTYHIIRFLLYVFMIAMIYPYLPGADSGVFQGISVFVGLIISLGSSTVIGNIIAGLVITYMRPFKIGDRIKLNDTIGNVIEKTPFVTRLKTPKNEVVTIPNSFILSSHTTNFTVSANDYGLIIHSEVTIGYDVPWRKVHQLLIEAANKTDGIENTPEPFVLETSLNDWYPVYQINAFTKKPDDMATIYSKLHQNIQDCFNKADVEILSPTYIATRDGNASTVNH